MSKRFVSLGTILILFLFACPAFATTLSDSLIKRFKTISYPEKEVVARITLQIEIPEISDDRIEDSVLLAYKIQAKLGSRDIGVGPS